MTQQYPVLEVENFGPIARSKVELRPLTLLVGPNNSGKSYLAKLAYALTTAVSAWGQSAVLGRDAWTDRLEELERALPRRALAELPEKHRELYRQAAKIAADRHVDWLRWSVPTYFGFSQDAWVNRNGQERSLAIRFGTGVDKSSFQVQLSLEGDEFRPALDAPLPDGAVVPVLGSFQSWLAETDQASDSLTDQLVRWSWDEILRSSSMPTGTAYYLPSGRSGLLAGAQVVAAAAVSIVGRRVGLEPIELAPFSGVEGDFVRTLILGVAADTNWLDREVWSSELSSALRLLEDLMGGVVLIKRVGPGRPVIVYRRDGLELPMEHSSSMVSDLAGIALWIKALLRPDDVLFIDEPEAHLHPENQRLIARVLVRLVNAGVRVVCATHSSLILHQVSNALLASTRRPDQAEELGFSEADRIREDAIAVYLFQPGDQGAIVSGVELSATEGIAEDEFGRVAEAIGDQTVDLVLAGTP